MRTPLPTIHKKAERRVCCQAGKRSKVARIGNAVPKAGRDQAFSFFAKATSVAHVMQASIALSQLRPLRGVSEEDVVRELCELGRDVADRLLRRAR